MTDLLAAAKQALPGLEFTQDMGAVACRGGEAWIAFGAYGAFYQMEARAGYFMVRTDAGSAWETRRTADAAVAWLRAQVTARRDALTAALGGGWVPVGERLPDLGRKCLVWTDLGQGYGSRELVDSETWLWADQYGDAEAFADVTVTHWLDLQPPKE